MHPKVFFGRLAFAALANAIVLSGAHADDALLGKDLVTPAGGQPICTDLDSLKEFLMAGIKQDRQWIQQVDGCAMLKGGLKVVVLEDLPSETEIMHVVKIRAFNARGSGIGYTISIGLRPK
jgi:hypothetical protein